MSFEIGVYIHECKSWKSFILIVITNITSRNEYYRQYVNNEESTVKRKKVEQNFMSFISDIRKEEKFNHGTILKRLFPVTLL